MPSNDAKMADLMSCLLRMGGTPQRSRLGLQVFGVVFAMAGLARAQHPEATAEQLFQEGRQLMQEGKYKEGCPKLAQSQRLDPAAGTLLNLGECYEKNNQLASAISSYKQAWELARERKRSDWTSFAEERMRALEPRVPRVRISGALPAGAHAELDGRPIEYAESQIVLRVDVGEHRLVVVSGERELVARTFVAAEGRTDDVSLDDGPKKGGPSPPANPPKVPAKETSGGGPSPAVWILGGASLGALALGGILLGVREGQVSSIVSDCGASGTALPAARANDCNDRGSGVGTTTALSIAAFGAGAVLAGSALVVYLTSNSSDARKETSRLRASCLPGFGGASCVVRF